MDTPLVGRGHPCRWLGTSQPSGPGKPHIFPGDERIWRVSIAEDIRGSASSIPQTAAFWYTRSHTTPTSFPQRVIPIGPVWVRARPSARTLLRVQGLPLAQEHPITRATLAPQLAGDQSALVFLRFWLLMQGLYNGSFEGGGKGCEDQPPAWFPSQQMLAGREMEG